MKVVVNKFAKNQPKRVLDEQIKFKENAKVDIINILNTE